MLYNDLGVDVEKFPSRPNEEVEDKKFCSSSESARKEISINWTPVHCITENIFLIPEINKKSVAKGSVQTSKRQNSRIKLKRRNIEFKK